MVAGVCASNGAEISARRNIRIKWFRIGSLGFIFNNILCEKNLTGQKEISMYNKAKHFSFEVS